MRERMMKMAAGATILVAAGTVAAAPAMAGGLYENSGYADPGYYAPPPVRSNLFEGWWLGGTLGANFQDVDITGTKGSIGGSGLLGGVTGGYNWQNGPIVIGFEGDVLAQDVSGSHTFDNGAYTARASQGTTGDIRLRAGVTVMPQLLIFGTLGMAIADGHYKVVGFGGNSNDATMLGWSIGGGAEAMLGQNWSARFDYQYTDFDSETVSYSGGKQHFDPTNNTFRGSLIYHF